VRKEQLALLKSFGANVRRIRSAQRMTQERLAELADLDVRHIRRLEAAERNAWVTTVVRIQEALGCRWDELMPKFSAARRH
jgi:transcriptional regulator with XRE-family HTH domain